MIPPLIPSESWIDIGSGMVFVVVSVMLSRVVSRVVAGLVAGVVIWLAGVAGVAGSILVSNQNTTLRRRDANYISAAC